MKLFAFLLIAMCCAAVAKAQTKHVIRFTDKKNSPYSISQPASFLSQRAIARRVRHNIAIDSTDLPVNKVYLDSLGNINGVTVLNVSKWLNQALVSVQDPAALDRINTFPFVRNTAQVSLRRRENPILKNPGLNLPTEALPAKPEISYVSQNNSDPQSDTINYGNNFPQVHIHQGEYLHNLGLRGQGMIIAMLDAGYFNYKSNPAFDSIRQNSQVLMEYDFVKNETSVDEDNAHGSDCLSMMAANQPGKMVGTAPGASYVLFRTEDVSSETPVEEQNWIAGAERADSLGVDIISSSLGYIDFDNSSYNYTYAARNGNTAMITIAADLAARKGIIVMNAAGNSGNAAGEGKYVACPADGDSVFAVGAINTSGQIGAFSSWGPNNAGKVKPNIVSVGWNAVYTNHLGNTATINGTSSATPNIAGLVACLWQAFSDFSNMEIIDAVQKSASQFLQPDDRYGYGIPNFRLAYEYLQKKREERHQQKLKDKWITAYPIPFKQQFKVFLKAPISGNASLRLTDNLGRTVALKNITLSKDNYYTIDMIPGVVSPGTYYLNYHDSSNKTVLKLAAF